MLRVFLILVILTIGLFSLYWLDVNNGVISLQALGYQIDTRMSILVTAVLFMAFSFHMVISLFEKIISIPTSIRNLIFRQAEKSNQQKLVDSVLFLIKNQKSEAGKALKSIKSGKCKDLDTLKQIGAYLTNISDESLSNIPSGDKRVDEVKFFFASSDIHNFNEDKVKQYFQNFPSEQSAKLVAKYYLLNSNYKELYNFFSKYSCKIQLEESLSSELFNIITNLYAQDLVDNGNYFEAISVLNKAENTSNKLYLMLLCYINLQDFDSAIAETKRSWKKCQSVESALLVSELLATQKPGKFYSLAKSLETDEAASNVLIAVAALADDKFNEAGQYISKVLDGTNSLTGSILMAEFCQKTHSGKLETIEWLRKALKSIPQCMHLGYIQSMNKLFLEKLLDS